MSWLPEWRISVGDDVYTTVTAASYSIGRLNIDDQCTAGYARVEIINTTNAPFTIDITDRLVLELKNSAGTYVTVFTGEVSDFSIGVRSPEENGFITTGTILGVGSLSKVTKAFYNTALIEELDGEQIAKILNDALSGSWDEVNPTITWATYPPTITWANAESYVGTIDTGLYTMIPVAAANLKSSNLVDQIAKSALGQIYETAFGLINYDDADHRTQYLAANGSKQFSGLYAIPRSIKSQLQIAKIRNSEIVNYGTSYASTYTASDTDSISTYGLFQLRYESNVKSLSDVTDIVTRDLLLRAIPRSQFGAITYRLDTADMPDALRDELIAVFFGEPVVITNLPENMFDGYFDGFIENITMTSTPAYVDLTLYLSPLDFSLVAPTWETVIPNNIIWSGVNATLSWNKAIGVLN
jgi:hypothetical protein